MIITIHGIPGSGKDSTIEELSMLLKDYKHISTGSIAREIAAQHGFIEGSAEKPFDKFPAHARKNNIPYDSLIDQQLIEIGNLPLDSKLNIILNCRLGYYFVKHSFKVKLATPLGVAAHRIFHDPKRKGKYESLVQVLHELKGREASDGEKYKELYDTDYSLDCHFNLIVSTLGRPAEVANEIYIGFKQWEYKMSRALLDA